MRKLELSERERDLPQFFFRDRLFGCQIWWTRRGLAKYIRWESNRCAEHKVPRSKFSSLVHVNYTSVFYLVHFELERETDKKETESGSEWDLPIWKVRNMLPNNPSYKKNYCMHVSEVPSRGVQKLFPNTRCSGAKCKLYRIIPVWKWELGHELHVIEPREHWIITPYNVQILLPLVWREVQ